MAGPSKALTFLDLMNQVGAGTRMIANIPGAKRIPESFARAQKGLSPDEIIEQYNMKEMFGRDQKTGVVRLLTQSPGYSSSSLPANDRARMARGKLPLESKITQQVVDPSNPRNILSQFELKPDRDLATGSYADELYRRMYDRAENAQRAKIVPDDVGVYDIGALNAGRLGGEGFGAMQYAALYDQLRAAGAFSGPTGLTDINELRRLGNVMSYGLRHGDYENIAPVVSAWGRSPQLFHRAEQTDWLARPLMDILQQGKGDPIFDAAVALKPVDLANMTPDQITGVLGLKEAQLNRIAGPVREPIMLEAADPGLLRHLAVPALTDPNAYGIQKGIGPNTLGRAATVEQLIEKILAGRTGEEAAEEILNQSKRRGMNLEEGFKGRYKDGGSVALFSGGGGVKKTVAEMAAELAAKSTKTPDMSRRKFMSLGNVFNSPTSTPNLPVTATEAAKMSQDPASSAIEKITEAPVSRRQVLQGALAQGAQRMLPTAAMQPVKDVASEFAKSMMRHVPAPSIGGLVAQGLKMGMGDYEIMRFVQSAMPEADPKKLAYDISLLPDIMRNPSEYVEDPDWQMMHDKFVGDESLMNVFGRLVTPYKVDSPMSLRRTMREIKDINPNKYGELKSIARDIFHSSNPNAGNHDYSGGGKVTKTVAEMAAELAAKGTKTPDMSRRKFMSLGSVFDSPTSTPNLPVTATEAAKMSQDPTLSAIEKIAETPVSRRQVLQGALAQGAQRVLPGISPTSALSRAIDAATSAPQTASTIPGLVAQGLNMKLKGQELVDFVNRSMPPSDVHTPKSLKFTTELLASNIKRPEPYIDMYYDYDPSSIRLQILTDQLFPEAKRPPSGMGLRPTLREIQEYNPKAYDKLVKSATTLRDQIAKDLEDD